LLLHETHAFLVAIDRLHQESFEQNLRYQIKFSPCQAAWATLEALERAIKLFDKLINTLSVDK
jgi:hypothetical protein